MTGSGTGSDQRVRSDGNHLSLGGLPWRVRGVTYGSFVPRLDGELFPERPQLKQDMADIAAAGFNTVRTYTPPSVDLLDITEELGLRVLVGIDYRDWRYEAVAGRAANGRVAAAGARAVDEALARLSGRKHVLGLSVGNEVPVDVVRLHGISRVERDLARLVRQVHEADAGMLTTYSNFPTTEFLDVVGIDFFSFNVFLERPEQLRPYLRHLQIVSDDRPLVITELGLASGIHGEAAQAESLDWQLRLVDEVGVAGATVFAWTDEWGVNGESVDGWGFGLTDADRRPKPSLAVASRWAHSTISELREAWPSVSVVVCAYNEARRITACLESLATLNYPDLQVIICDDGSTDETVSIAKRYPFDILELPHGGLSRARNSGINLATGEIVAFLDADAQCHPEWPYHIALALDGVEVVAAGGPNLPVEGAGLVERAVAASPGGPIHVLVSDDRAEHVPGCNMAYRREALVDIGGFDPVFTAAGDDVDVCWKILDRGGQIAFSAAAQVRHHRRDSLRGYLRQQRGYGRSERMVSTRHPERFNRLGQARWRGFIYGGTRILPSLLRPVVYHGYHGNAPYQSVEERPAETTAGWLSALLPVAAPLVALGLVTGWLWTPAYLLALGAMASVAGFGISVAFAAQPGPGERYPWRFRALVATMHVLQPLVRASGRLRSRDSWIGRRPTHPWTGDRTEWIEGLTRDLRARGCVVESGGPQSSWDLRISVAPLIRCRLTMALLWKWEPAISATWRLSPLAWLLFGTSAVLAGFDWPRSLLAPLVVVLLAVLDAEVLRRRTAAGIRSTTQGIPTESQMVLAPKLGVDSIPETVVS